MRIFLASVALGALAIAPLQADPGGGKGGGNGKGAAHGNAGGGGQGKGNGHDGGHRGGGQDNRGQGNAVQAGNGHGHGGLRAQAPVQRQAERRVERQVQRPLRVERQATQYQAGPAMHGKDKGAKKNGGGMRAEVETHGQNYRNDRRVDRQVVVIRDGQGSGPVRFQRRDAAYAVIDGCPPGLAKKNNGCLPPGLARQTVTTTVPWQQPAWYGSQWYGDRYRYYDGYLLRLGGNDSVLGYVPLLGGALAVGELWPSGYQEVAVPDYYRNFYDLGETDSYRYYDDAIYGVDQGDDVITSVIALLTGDTLNVGDELPEGYDVYNVPFEYRDQYVDGPDSMYRYSDGYVYEVDPKTQLIQAAIQLLAA